MSQLEFEQRVRAWRRVVRPLGIVYGVFVVAGPFLSFNYLFGGLQRWLLRLVESDTALSLSSVLLCVSIALPPLLGLVWQTRRGLACSNPKCGCTREFIRGVSRDGRCPRCERQIIDRVA